MATPNILVIMSDEHDANVIGSYGDPLVRTPNLDALAANGVSFDACYCNSPLCVPSRLSFTAGKHIHRVGAWQNTCWLPSDDIPSLPSMLRSAGYTPYLCGKQHYDQTRRYGFEDLEPSFNRAHKHGQGRRRNANDESVGHQSWASRSGDFHTGDRSKIIDHDRRVTETAQRFLQDRPKDDGPFMLFAGYLAPHFPLTAPEELYEHYRGGVPMPVLPDGLLDRQARNYHHLRAGFGIVDVPDELTQRGRDLYWALTEWFDIEVGRLLSTLADSAFADNTIVIYTSDHGENKGDHGLWWKNCLYDHGARVPLIVSYPPTFPCGVRRSQVCSLVDVVQTIVDLAGGSTPDDWDGQPLTEVLNDASAPWPNQAVSQYHGHNIASGMSMLREGRYKYIYHAAADAEHGPEYELYDMNDDPDELVNLAGQTDMQPRCKAMHRTLVDILGEDPEAIEQRCRQDTAVGYGRNA